MNILQYFPRNTFMHNIDSRIKILMYILVTITIFFANSFTAFFFIFIIMFFFTFLSKLPKKVYINTLISIIFIGLLTAIINVLVIQPGDDWLILFSIGSLEVSAYALFLSLEIMLRVYALILFTSVIINTTEQREMAYGLTWLIYPLKYIKIPVNEISLIITLGLRFIPTLFYEIKLIFRAQASRGLSWYSGGIITKTKALNNSFLPLFMNSFIRADDIANSMTARGYEIGEKRTSYFQPNITWRDLIYSFTIISLLTLVLLIRYVPDFPLFLDPEFYWDPTNPWW